MSTLGQPGDIIMCMAENSAASPWDSFHTAFGHSHFESVVTLAAVEGYNGILGVGQSREGFLSLVASWLKGHDRAYRNTVFLVIAQDTAAMLAREGWNRENMAAYIKEKAVVPFSEFKEAFLDTGMAQKGVPPWVFTETDASRMLPRPFLDNLQILVAGGAGEKSLIMPCWGSPVSSEIRLPSHWEELLLE
jgi:hypothetical protein